jgi:hypothetical protein
MHGASLHRSYRFEQVTHPHPKASIASLKMPASRSHVLASKTFSSSANFTAAPLSQSPATPIQTHTRQHSCADKIASAHRAAALSQSPMSAAILKKACSLFVMAWLSCDPSPSLHHRLKIA